MSSIFISPALNKITFNINNVFNETLKEVLEKISNDYGIEKEELFSKFLNNESNDCDIDLKKKKNLGDLSDNIRCIANTAKLTRCTKRKLPGTEFCGFHCKKQPFGTITHDSNDEVKIMTIDNVEFALHDKILYRTSRIRKIFDYSDKKELNNFFSKKENIAKFSDYKDGIMENENSVIIY